MEAEAEGTHSPYSLFVRDERRGIGARLGRAEARWHGEV